MLFILSFQHLGIVEVTESGGQHVVREAVKKLRVSDTRQSVHVTRWGALCSGTALHRDE